MIKIKWLFCPVCGKPMSMNLRADNTFVQDEGWYRASERYKDFVRRHQDLNVLYLELGAEKTTTCADLGIGLAQPDKMPVTSIA